jgi:hypothetical protein
MSSAPARRLAPLLPWALAALWLVLGYGALRAAWWWGIEPPQEALVAHYGAQLDALAADPAPLKVVVFGNSLTKHALPPDHELGAALASAAGRPAVALRVVDDMAIWSGYAPLLPALLAARPSVVVVQAELLAQDRIWDDWQWNLRSWLRSRVLEPGPWYPWGPDPSAIGVDLPCAGRAAGEDAALRIARWDARRRYAADAPSPRAAQSAVRALREAGVPVVVLTMPRSAAYRALRSEPSAIGAARAAAGAAGAVPLAFPGEVPDAQYCDAVHVAAEGRAAFSGWLVRELAARAAPR